MKIISAFLAGCCVLFSVPAASAQRTPLTVDPQLKLLNKAFANASSYVSPSVVSITVTMSKTDDMRLQYFQDYWKQFGRNFDADKYRSKSIGSGVFVNGTGYIVTNHHVVDEVNEDSIMVTLSDGNIYLADLIGSDPRTDLALLKIYGSDFPEAGFANSDAVSVGEWVLAVGSPLGLRSTVTTGIVSAIGRADFGSNSAEDEIKIQNYIQTDAAINPGNSGGGLFNLEGQLVGINTAMYSGASRYNIGYGLAIPSNLAKSVIEDLMEDGIIDRGYLGIDISAMDEKKSKETKLEKVQGVMVEDVDLKGPAGMTGFLKSDVILEIDDKAVNTPAELQNALAFKKAGDTVNFTIWNQQQKVTRSAILAKNDDMRLLNEINVRKASLGIMADPAAGASGIIISDVLRYSAAEKAGLIENDVITGIDNVSIVSIEDFQNIMATKKPGDKIRLQFTRNGSPLTKEVVLFSGK